jgi:hypothetical protein
MPAYAQQKSETISNSLNAENNRLFSGSKGNQSTSLTLDVNSKNEDISFTRPADFESSKVIKNYFHIKVEAPDLPWVVTATVAFEPGTVNLQTASRLSQIIQLQVNNAFPIRLHDRPVVIITNNPDNPSKVYHVDLIIDPPFDIDAGSLKGVINFHLELL